MLARTLLAVLGLVLAACGSDEPIRIGFIGGLSGRGADLGESGRNGAMLAIEQRRSNGGIDGRPLELMIRNDRQDAKTAREATRELIDAGVVAILGPMTSSMAAEVLPLADAAGVVVISPTATALAFSDKADHFFRVNGTTRDNALVYAQFLHERRELHRISVAYDERNAVFSRSWLKEFQSASEALGGEVVTAIPFDADTRFEQLMQDMLTADPDGLLFIANAVDTAQLCQQARKQAPHLPRSAAEWAATEELLQLGGRAVEGLYTVQSYDRDDSSPRYRAFVTAYLDRFRKEPSFPALAAFDATTILLAALEQARPGVSLRDTLGTLGEVEVLQQTVQLDRYGDISRKRMFTVISDNRFMTVE